MYKFKEYLTEARRQRHGTDSEYLKNKKMSPEVYKLRRVIIDMIYEFKKIIDLPRITVRVTEDGEAEEKNTMGVGTMDNRVVIWIPEKTLKRSEDTLREVIAHEIGHAVFKLRHDNSKMMNSTINYPAMTKQEVFDWFKSLKKK